MAVQARSSPMEKRLQLAVQISLVALACIAATIVRADTIKPSNGAGEEIGVLVDGYLEGSWTDDKDFKGPSGTDISIGNFTASPGEIIGFTIDRPPRVMTGVSWTSADNQTVDLTFEGKYCIDIYGWIITGPLDGRKLQAAYEALRTAEIWFFERQGVCLSSFNVLDMTQDQAVQAEDVYDHQTLNFSCGTATAIKLVLAGRPDFKAKAINVFYVANVQSEDGTIFGPEYGLRCPGHVILMGNDTRPNLLAHELGHALSLGEANDSPSLCPATLPLSCTLNVMHPATWSRQYLTEGQTFRAMVNTGSAINDTAFYNLRPGLEQRNCGTNDATPSCPALATRIWAEP